MAHPRPLAILAPVAAIALLPETAWAAPGSSTAALLLPLLLALTLFFALMETLALKWRLNPSWGRSLSAALKGKLLSTALGAPLAWAVFTLLSPGPEDLLPWLAALAAWFGLSCILEQRVARRMLRVQIPDNRRVRNAVFLTNSVGFGFLAGALLTPSLGRLFLG